MIWFNGSWLVALPALAGTLFVLGFPTEGSRLFRIDPLGLGFLGALVVLGMAIHRFARHNLAGDPRRRAFLFHLVGTLWSVQGLAVAENLGLYCGLWVLSSLGLHRLLGHYSHRPEARVVAWEKFLVSRMGDAALVLAGTGLVVQYHTLDLGTLQTAVDSGVAPLPWVGVALVVGVLVKSAQIPFHRWLPRTLEAPTPVSALLHAGILNAGGFLLIRCWFLLRGQEAALTVLVLGAGASILAAGLVLVVQPDVKRRLAWSTIGQMGFMLLEVGLGAPVLAFVHLVAHGLYKARGFLWSGAVPKTPGPVFGPGTPGWGRATAAWGVAGVGALGAIAWGAPGHLPLAACGWAALVPLVVRPSGSWGLRVRDLTIALGVTLGATLGLVAVGLGRPGDPGPGLGPALAGGLVAVGLVASGLLITRAPGFVGVGWYPRAYASALHGFGWGRWSETWVRRLVPGLALKGGL